MSKNVFLDFQVDKTNCQITVRRAFNAPVNLVWAAWTQAEILDLWWAPKPWKTRTKVLDFREGGQWLYAMIGPEGDTHWSKVDYLEIQEGRFYSSNDAFCDENGTVNEAMPQNRWENTFEAQGEQTVVHILMQFDSLADLEVIAEMGFKEGFEAGLQNLDAYLEAQTAPKRNEKRVSMYLNFPGTTEQAFLFYRQVFQTEFLTDFQRFRSIPPVPDQPPMPEAIKDLILHVSLPIMDGFILMGTDVTEELGMRVEPGNHMHLNLYTESREEATRLFAALSAGGTVTTPMQDMFWGAYYGSCIDKFGINWMVSHQNVITY